MSKKIRVGSQVTIPSGTRVTTIAGRYSRENDSTVTVRAIERTKAGNTKVIWKSNGYKASAVLA